mgnify:CR=1 FL=1
MSIIKVDTIATRTGSGNITASNTIAGNVTGNVTGDTTGTHTGNVATNSITTASGSTITVPTGKQLIVTDTGGVRVPGTVLQTVFAEHASEVSLAAGGYIDSGLTATITPKSTSSKILVQVSMQFRCAGNAGHDAGIGWRIVRGSTNVWTSTTSYRVYAYESASDPNQIRGSDKINYLDSPSSTSALVYKIQGVGYNAGNNSNIKIQDSNNQSSMVLMEIAQ